MSALPAKELTTKQVKGVRFGFYTDEEVKSHVLMIHIIMLVIYS
jgi:hypothetical protein